MKRKSKPHGAVSREIGSRAGPLFADLYELTMAACYHAQGMEEEAAFSLHVREYPKNRNYLIAAGLQDVLRELSGFHFSPSEIAYLRSLGQFTEDFLGYLNSLRFTGSLFAMPEGTIFFPEEPILEVHAPIIQAQILETFLLNTMGFQSMIASKASRCVQAARGKPLYDFSARRAQGFDAALKAARSSYIAGFSGTSNVMAAEKFGIPASGTMAHSFVMAFESEADAFSAYAAAFPDTAVFLIDTYDTLQGSRYAVRVAKKMAAKGKQLLGVRLDSGDVVALSKQVRKILDDAGLHSVKIFVSGGMDEEAIQRALMKKGKIDAFGVGTRMGVSADEPYLDIVYKMVRFNDRNVRKLSPEKITLTGEKQVFRKIGKSGRFAGDIIGLQDEVIKGAEPLLKKVMRKGKIVGSPEGLKDIRARLARGLEALSPRFRSLKKTAVYPVDLSKALQSLQESVDPQG